MSLIVKPIKIPAKVKIVYKIAVMIPTLFWKCIVCTHAYHYCIGLEGRRR